MTYPVANHPVYTAGYALRQPDELLVQVKNQNARLLDIRLHSVSSKPGWNREELAALFGSRYRHVPALGNLGRFVAEEDAYAGGDRGIRIANLKWGLGIVEQTLTAGPVVLLCGCKEESLCHRRAVGDALRERGHRVSELGPFYRLRGMPLSEFATTGLSIQMYSEVLGCEIVLAADNAVLPLAETRTVYRARELVGLEKWTAEGLRLLHETKTVFGGEIVEDTTRRPAMPTADMFEVAEEGFTIVDGGGERRAA